jgi:hypothetical protein
VLVRSNNHLPLGQLRFTQGSKPSLNYFTRLAAASYRCSSRGFLFAKLTARERRQWESVNAASSTATCVIGFRGTEPTSLARSFPGRPGLSVIWLIQTFVSTNRIVLSMNWGQATRNCRAVNEIIYTGLFTDAGFQQRVYINVSAADLNLGEVVHRGNLTGNPWGE